MIKFRTRPRGLEYAQDDYIFNSPNIIKITPEEFLELEIRMALNETHPNGKPRFIPMDNVLWQAAQIIETDLNHEFATAVGVPIKPYIEYMELRGIKTRPQLDASTIPSDLKEEYSKPSETEYRFDKWVLIGRSKDKDEHWALITLASTREFLESNLDKARDALGDGEDEYEYMIVERIVNLNGDESDLVPDSSLLQG